MKKILVLDACIRRNNSRTRLLMDKSIEIIKGKQPDAEIEVLSLQDLGLGFFNEESLAARDAELKKKNYEHPRFSYARQFRDADGIVIAAPFWDLSIPAVLKVYIENVSADGLTFYCDEEGMHGMCKASWMLFLTTRGGVWAGDSMEQGTTYMEALSRFFGIDSFCEVHADGVDIVGNDTEAIMQEALAETAHATEILLKEMA